jgi:predicted ArsR family transcriptional regulator
MGPVTVAEIAAQTGVSESSVRRHLAELESSGLIESDDYQRRARVFMPA